jgi:hypothetical protein
MPDHASARGREDAPGTTRRGMLRGAAGLGAAGAAMAVLVRTAGPATAAAATQPTADQGAEHQEPLVVHVHDARTGVVDLYTGTRHVRVTDRELAARLARAAR